MRREEPCLPVRRYFRGGRTWLETRRKGEKCQVRQAEGSLNSAYCISFRGALLALGVTGPFRPVPGLSMAVIMVTMSMPSTRKSPRSGRPPAGIQSSRTGAILLAGAFALFCLGGLFAEALMPLLRYDRPALANHEWWRLVSAHLVHFDLKHGVLNAAALVLTGWIVGSRVAIAEWLLLSAGSLIAVDVGLYWLSPDVGWYVGASGLLHGLFAGGALVLAVRERDVTGGIMLLLLAGKLAYEHLSGGTSLFMDGAGFAVVTEAHLYGAMGGLATALGILAVRHRR